MNDAEATAKFRRENITLLAENIYENVVGVVLPNFDVWRKDTEGTKVNMVTVAEMSFAAAEAFYAVKDRE